MTSKREREHARSRQQKRQERQAVRAEGRRRSRTVNLVVGFDAALVVLGVVVAAAFLGDDGPDATQAGAQPSAAPAPTAGAGAAPVDGTCPPGVEPVVDPVQLDTVPPPVAGPWTVSMSTTCGDVVLELDAYAAPVGVGSFVGLTQAGYYDATPCHRLTTQGIFVLQCGDPTGTGTGGPGYT